jgi:UDP-N-acetylglucosamine acyltransferase
VSTRIHPTAIVAPGAELDDEVEVGPYAVIGEHVRIGRGTRVGPHAVIENRTTIGAGSRIFQFAAVGAIPQDLKYRGEPSELVLGERNVVREFATLHIGTEGGGGVTVVGDDNLLMNFCHVAHDCRIGSRAVLANGATLGGHVTVADHVIVGGLAAVHQFVRLGESAMAAGGAIVVQDVPPYCVAAGNRATLAGLNVEGLRRRGFAADVTRALRRAYRAVFRSGVPLRQAVETVRAELGSVAEVARFLDFVETSKRGVCRVRGRSDEDE